MFVMNNTCI